ncbi:hypothetical protein ACJMK2_033516 [Sinanodonta woodiana]|uniref:ATP synthase mitochondrial F1 complex assembly factor 2 n=1 Tax=Sinanodonta woodiana TaxID=1069815 RepID=A0ABD3WSS0_SINWO
MAAPLKMSGSRCTAFAKLLFSYHRPERIISMNPQIRFYSTKELKKFYRHAYISQHNGWFEINLDKRKLRTPTGNLFRVPNEALALAVATEWNAQENTIKRHNMHLTSLCNMAIDNPTHRTREDLIQASLYFLETDTVCYRLAEPEELLEFQCQQWDPVIDWFKKRYKVEIETTTGIASLKVPEETYLTLERHLLSMSDWALFGYHYCVEALRSVILTMALIDRHISVERAVQLSRVEQDFQVNRWGSVEWYHDINLLEIQCHVAASNLFVYWTSENSSIKQKAMLTSSNM